MEIGFVTFKARIAGAKDDDRRAGTRVPVKIDARVRELGSEGCEARIVNLSSSGFMAEAEGVFEVGSRVWLILPGRERANALVRWTAGNKLGAEFDQPIDVKDFAA